VEITAKAVPIDGPFGTLGQAEPTAIRGARGLPYTGEMEFDTADMAMMTSEGTLAGVILHEMGHVLGIGTLWQRFGLVTGIGSNDPQYIGARGLAAYQRLVGTGPMPTGVPVENTGGEGTAGSHWRESVFDAELMTGTVELPPVVMPISELTIGSLEDLDYVVNYLFADPYRLPRPGVNSPTAASQSANIALALTAALDQQRPKPVQRAAAFANWT
jgi:hypothetical protein